MFAFSFGNGSPREKITLGSMAELNIGYRNCYRNIEI